MLGTSPLLILAFVIVVGVIVAIVPMDDRFKTLAYYICAILTVIAIVALLWPFLTRLA